ncbi:MAG: hypothetical protein R3F11_26365 [Verrucomicrobiales bacterium]
MDAWAVAARARGRRALPLVPARGAAVFGALAGGAAQEQALNDVCRRYWFPLYAWLRRSVLQYADAEDLVQSFPAHPRAEAFDRLERRKAKMRLTWLLHLLKNHAIGAWRLLATLPHRGETTT